MRLRAILATLLFLLATLPIAPQEVVTARRRAAGGGGGAVTLDSHNYFARGTLSTCADGQDPFSTQCVITTSYSIPTSGDAVYIVVNGCWNAGCSTTPSAALSITDGTNTYLPVAAATQQATSWNVYWFKSCNTTSVSGATLTFHDAVISGTDAFYYVSAEQVTFKDSSAVACEDTAVTNTATGTSSAATVTSLGNVTTTGEYGIASSFCAGQNITATGAYTALDLPGIADRPGYVQKSGLTGSSPTTAATTCAGSTTWYMSVVAVQ